MKIGLKKIEFGTAAISMALWPSSALAETGFGEAAATEITLIIPQATLVGLAVIGVLGVIVAVMAVIGMLRVL